MIDRILNYEFSVFRFQISGNKIVKHPFFAGSAIMIVGTNIANFMAYLYHLVLGRMLGPANYGDLDATLALLGEFSTIFTFLGLVIVKFASSAKDSERSRLFNWFYNKSIVGGVILLIGLLVLSPQMALFLKLPLKITLLIGPTLFLVLFMFLYQSFLQGLLEFSKMVIVTNLNIFSRLTLGVVFVALGFSAFGGVMGIFVGTFFAFIMARRFLSKYRFDKSIEKFKGGKKVLKYALPVFIVSLSNNSLISTDVILAKHYFSAHQAGIYASLSTLSKIIFYGTGPVSAVMFPIVSKKFANGNSYKKTFYLSLLLTCGIAFSVLAIYYLLPHLMVNILFGREFLEGTSALAYFGLFLAIFTISNLFISLQLSIERTNVMYFPMFFAIVQIIGITIYHSSILDIVRVSIVASTLLLFSQLIYFAYDRKGFKPKTK